MNYLLIEALKYRTHGYVGTYRIDLNTGEIAREGGEDLRSVKKEED